MTSTATLSDDQVGHYFDITDKLRNNTSTTPDVIELCGGVDALIADRRELVRRIDGQRRARMQAEEELRRLRGRLARG